MATPKRYRVPAEVRRLHEAIKRLKLFRSYLDRPFREAVDVGIEHIDARLIDLMNRGDQ
jgi:hypothetical protein